MMNQKIPKTDSIEELARFWDVHDLTDFEDELEEVTEPVFQRKTVSDAGGGQTVVDSDVGGETVTFDNPISTLPILTIGG